LAALCAVGARAGVVAVPDLVVAPVGVHALLVGGPSTMPSFLAQTVTLQTSLVSAMTPSLQAAQLKALSASPVVAERVAARIVALKLQAKGGETAALPEVEALAASAKADPAFSQWFDGAKPSLELDGLALKRGAWRKDDKPLDRLGQGEYGFVDEHPAVPGAVLKTVEHSGSIALFTFDTPEKSAAGEEASADLLSAADAGPRHLGRGVHGRRLVSVRERVYGETTDDLMRSRRFGPEEKRLVTELLARLAAAGVLTNDLRPSNIMIGTTLLDPRRRAWIVDGGQPVELAPGTVEQRLETIVNTPVMLRGRMDPHMGFVEFSKPWRIMFEEGLERWGRDTRWKRFKGFWKDLGAAMIP
jgi:hypothetical protein